ncbi:recQ-mediated genome instability protein 2 isoform X1 [Mesocricetus auratus]|uniref:RecQ-mediated genome instability protein 2 isoform X1 n=1 Tax=Mesocricetus auratus TaxID=10036 RepID=A0A3Q0DA70_MESAU|nr:recQ-mediated genome instability protein 2 isoform X1 [Mesocricetus auratus]
MAAAESLTSGGPGAVRLPRSPPLKVLAEQLRRHAEGGPGTWRLSRAAVGRAPLELAAVWMQGTVLAAEGGQARLRDPSGAFSVRGLERVPRGRPCLLPGDPKGYEFICVIASSCPADNISHPPHPPTLASFLPPLLRCSLSLLGWVERVLKLAAVSDRVNVL